MANRSNPLKRSLSTSRQSNALPSRSSSQSRNSRLHSRCSRSTEEPHRRRALRLVRRNRKARRSFLPPHRRFESARHSSRSSRRSRSRSPSPSPSRNSYSGTSPPTKPVSSSSSTLNRKPASHPNTDKSQRNPQRSSSSRKHLHKHPPF